MKSFAVLLLFSFFAISSLAQSPPGPFLKSADVDRFLKTQAQMTTEFETLEDQFDSEESEEETYEAILAAYKKAIKSDDAVKIINKYGWDIETYGEKMMAIALGTTYLISLKYMEDMPPEQRTMMEEMFVKQYRNMVHPDDIEVLKPNLDKLEELFKEM